MIAYLNRCHRSWPLRLMIRLRNTIADRLAPGPAARRLNRKHREQIRALRECVNRLEDTANYLRQERNRLQDFNHYLLARGLNLGNPIWRVNATKQGSTVHISVPVDIEIWERRYTAMDKFRYHCQIVGALAEGISAHIGAALSRHIPDEEFRAVCDREIQRQRDSIHAYANRH